MANPEQLIRERAYHLWIGEGCPEGRADFHWHVAREQVLASLRSPAAKPRTKRAPAAQRAGHPRRLAKTRKPAAQPHA
jgi:Protein of unknown function (DUF2934)